MSFTKLSVFIFAVLIFSNISRASEEVNVKVKGMVCSFCAQGIKKKFTSEAAVSKVDVNLDEKWVKLSLKDGQQLGDDRIKALITDAGYNVESIARVGAEIASKPVPKKTK